MFSLKDYFLPPTEQADEEADKSYYDQLTSVVNDSWKAYIPNVMGDLNELRIRNWKAWA